MNEFETLRLETVAPHVRQVTLSRPAVANAINTRMGHELVALFEGLNGFDHEWRAIVVTGEGRFFCSGGDLKERRSMSQAEWRAQHLVFEKMMSALLDCPIPVIAAVNGPAYAGGFEIAAACDFIYAAPEASFALTEVTLGFMPGSTGTQTLPRAVGERRAKELLLTGGPFSAEEAAAWQLVNRVVPADELIAAAVATASRIARNAPLATRKIKHVVHHGLPMDLRSGWMLELEAYGQLVATEDRAEGVRAFSEKRQPRFKGR